MTDTRQTAGGLDSLPVATVFAYKCRCGLAFTFEVEKREDQSSPARKPR
jgi:hypothetical protein